jgi:hypothetical protein
VLAGRADIVVADRQVDEIEHFSWWKRRLQKFGSSVVNLAATTELPDAASGFRAYSRESLLRLNTVTRFSYCMETIIQAGNKRLAITSTPDSHEPEDPRITPLSRTSEHVAKSMMAITRSYMMYRATHPLSLGGGDVGHSRTCSDGSLLVSAVVVPNSLGVGRHIQSLLIGAVLLIVAFFCLSLGVIADLIRINRSLIENSLELQKRQMFAAASKDSST